MRPEVQTGLSGDVPIVLSQWYDTTKWILEKIDSFPKNQRFIFGQRIADRTLNILEGLVQASYTGGREKSALLETANRDLAVLRMGFPGGTGFQVLELPCMILVVFGHGAAASRKGNGHVSCRELSTLLARLRVCRSRRIRVGGSGDNRPGDDHAGGPYD